MAATVQHTVAQLTAAVDTTLAVQVGRRSVGVGGPTPVETASHPFVALGATQLGDIATLLDSASAGRDGLGRSAVPASPAVDALQ